MSAIAFLAICLSVAQPAPVALHQVHKAGEKKTVEVRSHLITETKQLGLGTYIPDELDLQYDFTTEVMKEKSDGIVEIRYKRPTMTQIEGETEDRPPKKTVEKLNMEALLTLSPINEIIDMKDLTPKKPEKGKGGGGSAELRVRNTTRGLQGAMLGGFVQEIYRLALFVGSLDSALDFQPKLPYQEVEPGATWKRTASYTPQKLKSKEGKTVMQRLDYLYTYVGVVDAKGVKVHRVTADLEMNTDLLKYIKDSFENGEEATQDLKEVTLNLKSHIDYDLDLKTCQTLLAKAESKGGFKVVANEFPNDPVVDQKITGRTTMKPGK